MNKGRRGIAEGHAWSSQEVGLCVRELHRNNNRLWTSDAREPSEDPAAVPSRVPVPGGKSSPCSHTLRAHSNCYRQKKINKKVGLEWVTLFGRNNGLKLVSSAPSVRLQGVWGFGRHVKRSASSLGHYLFLREEVPLKPCLQLSLRLPDPAAPRFCRSHGQCGQGGEVTLVA
uniref:Uncharacterized protein n=1 Tax=Molossus molossus TaxID=27622 RepID=A0A7J8CRZ0_MOLMO|nr:hypothetical protein HJG59_009816 [Molossus molossus]